MARRRRADEFLDERIAPYGIMDADFSLSRAELYRAFLDLGHDARTADQFAFFHARRSREPAHPNGYAAYVALMQGDHPTWLRLWHDAADAEAA